MYSQPEALDRALRTVEEAVKDEFLTRWSFERHLDHVAHALREYMIFHIRQEVNPLFEGELGCSIFYILPSSPDHCVLGGGSTDRRRMAPGSRSYDLKCESSGFTAFSLARGVTLCFGDFKKAIRDFSNPKVIVEHKSQACESSMSNTRSFLCYPLTFPSSNLPQPTTVQETIDISKDKANANLASLVGAVRFSTSQKEFGSKLYEHLKPEHRGSLATIISRGASSIERNARNHALTLN